MKIAYLIMAHRDPGQVKRLVESIIDSGDCFIHIDKKTDDAPFRAILADYERVFFMKNRTRVNWAAWSIVCVYTKLLEMAYHLNANYDRFVFLTGQDYPLMTNEEIIAEFSANRETEYIMAYNIVTSTVPTDKNKILKRWYFENPFNNKLLRRAWASLTYRCITLHSNRKKLTVPLNGVEVDPYFGQMLSAFTRKGAEKIISVYRNDKKYNRVMKHVHAPDEIYWQTIIFNSDLRPNTVQNGKEHEITEHFGWAPLHFHSYDDQCSVYEEKDYEMLKDCGYMFCRKVIPGISDKLMDKIDEMRINK